MSKYSYDLTTLYRQQQKYATTAAPWTNSGYNVTYYKRQPHSYQIDDNIGYNPGPIIEAATSARRFAFMAVPGTTMKDIHKAVATELLKYLQEDVQNITMKICKDLNICS